MGAEQVNSVLRHQFSLWQEVMMGHGVYLIEVDWDTQITVAPEWNFIAFLSIVPATSSRPLTHSVGTPNMMVAG